MSQEQLLAAIISALIASCLILIADLLTGEAEYRCGAKARINLRKEIFGKMLQLDVDKLESWSKVIQLVVLAMGGANAGLLH